MLGVRETGRPRDEKPEIGADQRPRLLVLLAAPRGFCAGVRRAIDAVRDALVAHGPPVYVRRPIVHNLDVVRSLEAEGAIFVQELDEVPAGSVVLFSAHGVAPAIALHAERRGLIAFDAVCPLVSKVHREVERHSRDGRQIVLIGHQGHPEIDGTLGYVGDGRAFVVSSADQVAQLPLADDRPTAYAVQTTYSVEEASGIIEALSQRFSDLAGPTSSDICYATTNRQQAVRDIAERADAFIVVGELFSSNACRLAEVAQEYCDEVQLVAGPEQVDWHRLPTRGAIGITAAASTPDSAVRALLAALSERYDIDVKEVESSHETTVFKRMAVA